MNDDQISEHKERLDVEMTKRGLARSRSMATDLISRGKVAVNGKIAEKQNIKIAISDLISVSSQSSYVSRAGEKLAHALTTFKIDVEGLEVIDIGSSTGGFTDCLLQRGAKKVIAVDVGTNQLVSELRSDPRIEIHESTDVRRFTFTSLVDLAVVDVSFISLSLVLSKIYELLKNDGKAIVLVKPQFEVGMEMAKKYEGVITDESLQIKSLQRVKSDAIKAGFKVLAETVSPITGEKGNREFLLLLQR